MSSKPTMQHIPPTTLRDLPTRLAYLHAFLAFTPAVDGAAIQRSAALLAPQLPALLDAVYTTLLSFDITAAAFAPPQPGLAPAQAARTVQDLGLDHPAVRHRKEFLKAYLLRLVQCADWAPAADVWRYMDMVAVFHTGEQRDAAPGQEAGKGAPAGDLAKATARMGRKRRDLRVEYVHLGALLGFVEDAVVAAVMGADAGVMGAAEKVRVLRAWNKLLWIQNDLFARHYVVDEATGTGPRGREAVQSSTFGLPVFLMLIVGLGIGYLVSTRLSQTPAI